MITFNKPYFSGKELDYIKEAIASKKLSGNGVFTQKCQDFFEDKYGFKKCLLTHSATAALDMIALLLEIQPGDEVIVPSFTFVSTANSFASRGAKIIFADSCSDHPNMDPGKVEALIGPKTKAIVLVHYAGVACDMPVFQEICRKHQLYLIEDAAHAIHSFYHEEALGGMGHFAAISFHETKNIIAGEGGLLVINDQNFVKRAEIIWEKGTNRTAFARHETQKYEWLDKGSSFLPSELTAAFLFAQLEQLDSIQMRRHFLWGFYAKRLKKLELMGKINLHSPAEYANHNAHLFYFTVVDPTQREPLLQFLEQKGIQALSHYLPLHLSPFHLQGHSKESLPHATNFAASIVRLPMYYELGQTELDFIAQSLEEFFNFG